MSPRDWNASQGICSKSRVVFHQKYVFFCSVYWHLSRSFSNWLSAKTQKLPKLAKELSLESHFSASGKFTQRSFHQDLWKNYYCASFCFNWWSIKPNEMGRGEKKGVEMELLQISKRLGQHHSDKMLLMYLILRFTYISFHTWELQISFIQHIEHFCQIARYCAKPFFRVRRHDVRLQPGDIWQHFSILTIKLICVSIANALFLTSNSEGW